MNLFVLAKFFKDCGLQCKEIKNQMERYENNKMEVLDEVIAQIESKITFYEDILKTAKKLKKEGRK